MIHVVSLVLQGMEENCTEYGVLLSNYLVIGQIGCVYDDCKKNKTHLLCVYTHQIRLFIG